MTLRAAITAPKLSHDPLLTIEEVRDKLALTSNQCVYRLVRKGMPVRRLGRALRFDRAEVEQWTKRHQVPERPTLVILPRGA